MQNNSWIAIACYWKQQEGGTIPTDTGAVTTGTDLTLRQ